MTYSIDEWMFKNNEKKPRGAGPWTFEIRCPGVKPFIMKTPAILPYSEAKKLAIDRAQGLNASHVYLLP